MLKSGVSIETLILSPNVPAMFPELEPEEETPRLRPREDSKEVDETPV